MLRLFAPGYRHIFFDLDRTLWDFEKNSEQALLDMYAQHPLLGVQFVDSEVFVSTFKRINSLMWSEYHRGNITKEHLRRQRFYQTLRAKNIDSYDLADKLDRQYMAESPRKTALMPQAVDILEYLRRRGYRLHIITNGFSEVQHVKLRCCGIDRFFDSVTTSEMARCQKPHAPIFEYAMRPLRTQHRRCMMVGDDWGMDVVGAKNVGWGQVFYNPQGSKAGSFAPTKEVRCLSELKNFL